MNMKLPESYPFQHCDHHTRVDLGSRRTARSKQEALKQSILIIGWLFSEFNLAPFLDLPTNEEPPLLAETVHLDDVVESHVKALDR